MVGTAGHETRAGRFVQQPGGYAAFIPNMLPPTPPVQYSARLVDALARADRAIGRLDGAAHLLPNPDLFVAMYVRKEAVLSSRIENTQASLADVLEFEAKAPGRRLPKDVGEVVNYVRAMTYGLERLETLPLSLRLIREIHAELLRGVRGGGRAPGQFRSSPNWIGPPGCTLADATYVPPPVPEMHAALGNLETYMQRRDTTPLLVRVGLAHAQFETIHPFLDGNGRVGRLLITFMLCQREAMRKPLLYLSRYLVAHRDAYYDCLTAIREAGQWEPWLEFFLRGVADVGHEATEKAGQIIELQRRHQDVLAAKVRGPDTARRLLDLLYETPVITMPEAARRLGKSRPTANSLISQFVGLGLLVEITGRTRYRVFRYQPYVDLLNA